MEASTPGLQALVRAGITFQVHPYEMDELDDDVTYGEAVARRLGFPPQRLFKTLVATVDDDPVVAIVPTDARLSTKALARAHGGKRAELADPADAERLTGYVTGGISPFGRRKRLPVYVDESIDGFETVLVSAGKRGLQVEVRPADLISLLGAERASLV